MNNLRRFNTEADYSAATLNYPAVSWVVSGDTVHFDKSAPAPTVNDKVMMSFQTEDSEDGEGQNIRLYNGDSESLQSCTSVTLNDVDVMADLFEGELEGATERNTVYVAKYGISGTTINDYFETTLGGGFGGSDDGCDFLIPSQITSVDALPNNVRNLVIEATTPPTALFEFDEAEIMDLHNIYVPTASVSAYQSAWEDKFDSSYFLPISQYSGNLPV